MTSAETETGQDPPQDADFARFMVWLLAFATAFVALVTGFFLSGGLLALLLAPPTGFLFFRLVQAARRLGLPRWWRAPPADLFRDLSVGMIDTRPDGHILRANAAAIALLDGFDPAGHNLFEVVEGMGRSLPDRMADTLKGFNAGRPEMARFMRAGEESFLQLAMSKMTLGGRETILVTISDATEFKTLEAQFVQSQKMQAVGQLAGGVAHDFNNLLTAISGHADLLLQRCDRQSAEFSDLDQIRQNAARAAALVRQLLAFSRKQTLRPRSIRLDETLGELSHLLNRLLGEKVALHVEHGRDLKTVRVDERQFEQVVMNLVVNARDAMPDGGTVVIRTRNEILHEPLLRDRATVNPGPYVVVEVHDTGVGIPADVRPKIFEPFFTTKKQGEGTGLGLATVYGIVKQTGGFIFVDSAPDTGTCFSIYLPAFEATAEAGETPDTAGEARPAQDLTGRGHILLVEDEAPVRSFAARALKLRGYSVTEAASGEEALDILSDRGVKFDVYVSDVVMPGKDGPTWVREAMQERPDARVVFVSGYAEDAFGKGKGDIPHAAFLAKPFSLVELTQKVKEQIEM